MLSGVSLSASLPSTTSPAMGLYTSEAAFTDSTTAQDSPALRLRPFLGGSTNTRSPSAAWAWSVMPTVATPSAPSFTHSWLLVYFRSAGILLMVLSVMKKHREVLL